MTLEEVADRASVSPSTVSRVLSNTGRVSSGTRARVLKIAAALHYRPDFRARALRSGKSRTLGLIVSNLDNPFFLDIFRTIEADAHQAGYALMVANTGYRPQRLVAAAQWMLGQRMAGLALVASETEPALLQELGGGGIPIVCYGAAGLASPNVISVRTDDDYGMQRAVDYLRSLGHRRIAYVGHRTDLQPMPNREKAYLGVVARFADDTESVTACGEDSPTGGRRATQQLLASGFAPSAIVCANDYLALGVLRALREQGLRVPADVSLVGYDNISLTAFATPPLTTVHVPREEIGHIISSALLAKGEGSEAQPRELIVRPEMLIRDSTAPADGRDAGITSTPAPASRRSSDS